MAVWGDKKINQMVADGLITSKDDISVGNASLDVRLGYSYKRLMPRDAVELGERLTFMDECCGEDGIIINLYCCDVGIGVALRHHERENTRAGAHIE